VRCQKWRCSGLFHFEDAEAAAVNEIQELVQEILKSDEFINGAYGRMSPLMKADSLSGGVSGQQLVAYDLQPEVNMLYPYGSEVTPLILGNPKRGIPPLPRVAARGGTATHWKSVTKINSQNISGGVQRGQRGGTIVVDSNDLNAPFLGMGLESSLDWEADYENGNLTPESKAIVVEAALRSLIIFEERALVLGNSSLALGTTPTPTVTDGAATGGTVTTLTTLSVICVALSGEGNALATVAGGVQATVIRANADKSSASYGGGSARKSAAGTTSITTSHTYLASIAAVSGAVAYAWYWGAAGAELLGAITGISGIEIKADAAGTQTAASLPASDNSKNALVPDGILTQMAGITFGPASGSYIKVMANGTGAGSTAGKIGTGTNLTSDNNGGIVEIDNMLKDRYDNYKIGGSRLLVSSADVINLTNKALNGSSSALTSMFRFDMEADKVSGIIAGRRVTAYHNKWMGNDLDIVVHPNLPAGNIVLWSDTIPYSLPNVTNILQARVRQAYYQIEWPLVTRQWQFGCYIDEAFENHFPPGFGWITNISQV
jgi:hypothetical protein